MASDSKAKAIEAYSFLYVLANDGRIDANELAMIKRLALRDGIVDDDERFVLQGIFARIDEASTDPTVWADIQSFKQQYGIR